MKTSNPWFKAADIMLGLFLLLPGIVSRLLRKPSNPSEGFVPSSFLIVKLCCLGDSMLSLIALSALKRKYSGSSFTVLCTSRNSWIYERSALFDEVVILPITGLKGIREIKKLSAIFRVFNYLLKRCYDAVIDLDVYYRFTTVLAFSPDRKFSAGFRSPRSIDRAAFYDYSVNRDMAVPEWKQFYELLAPFKLEVSPDFVMLSCSKLEIELAKRMIASHIKDERKLIAIVPGSSENWKQKRWSPQSFASMMTFLAKTGKFSFVIIGTKDEASIGNEIVALFGNKDIAVNVAGKTTPGVLVALISQIDGMVSNDTGPMHMAALAGKPVVGLFGPTDERKWTPPSKVFKVMTSDCPKRPCDRISRMPQCSQKLCLDTIVPEKVADVLVELLNSVAGNK
ncbi:MAG: glycosyltransferase family 9 protein [Fibrobacteres bacterium]|nr:glycosyltransferase family 9 protein [Fibrobacterota bacterium]